MGASEIILDPKIRDWVLIPLTIIMVFMGLGRHYASKLMRKETSSGSSCSMTPGAAFDSAGALHLQKHRL